MGRYNEYRRVYIMKKSKLILSILFAILLIVIILIGYRVWEGTQSNHSDSCEDLFAKVNLGDFGLITGQPSGPPCYLGICPEVSKKSDVVKALQKYGLIDYCKLNAADLDGGERCGCFSNILFNADDTVSEIVFSTSPYAEVSQIIDKYKMPDGIYLDNYSVLHGNPVVKIYFFYDRYRMIMGLMPQDGDTYSLSDSTKITGVTYNSENNYEESKTYYKKIVWKGYGEYDKKDYGQP
jgi:hypothetical protein